MSSGKVRLRHVAAFSGSRKISTAGAFMVRISLGRLHELHAEDLMVVVGDCPTGVDRVVRDYCKSRGIDVLCGLANWNLLGRRAGPRRNSAMVEVVVALKKAGWSASAHAFPSLESRGTRNFIGLCQVSTLEIEVMWVDGGDALS